MKKITFLASVICLGIMFFSACKKDDNKPTQLTTYKGKQITSFSIVTPSATGVIDTINKTITITVPTGTNLTSLTPNIVLASGLSITPASGQAQNFSSPVTYTIKLPDGTTSTWVVSVQTTTLSATVTVDQDISQSITWTADKVYIVNGEINIGNGAVLTIQPGTIIKFNTGSSLSVGYYSNATLIANGTVDKPITFTSSAALPAAGAWNGIYFYSNTLSNSLLNYCKIQFAGSDNSYGALNLIGCDVPINYCTISNSGSYGVYTEYNSTKGGFVTFTNNTITNATNYGIVINAQRVGSIGSANTITGTKGVYITGDFNSTTAQTWKNLNVPYIIANEVDIDGNLTIEAGTTFKFEANGWLAFGYNANTTVNMVGTITSPITFTANASSPTSGAWQGMKFYNKTLSTSNMSYCIVDYAGSDNSRGAVDLGGCSITFTYNTIRNCNSFGMILDGTAGFKAFNNNNISASDHLITISAFHVPDLGTPNTLTAAAGKGILAFYNANYSNAVTWKKQTADFFIEEEMELDGAITFEAGTNFKFNSNGFFDFGYNANTTLTATGTSLNPIKFTSSSSLPAAGSWEGLVFYTKTLSNTALNYCILEYCGSNGAYGIYTEANMSVNNSQINTSTIMNQAAKSGVAIVVSGTNNNFTWVNN